MTKKHSLYIRFDVDLDMSAPSQREMERIANLAISMLDKVPQNIRAGRVAGVLYGPDGNHILGEFALTPRFEAPK